jgi:hypothetical protein
LIVIYNSKVPIITHHRGSSDKTMVKKTSDPITVYTEQEIDKRYKKIIINELIREHERAQKLASSLNDIKSKILEVSNLSSNAKEGETDKETVLRLSTFLHTVNDKFKTVSDSFAAFNKYCNPERVEENVEEMDYDNVKSEPQSKNKNGINSNGSQGIQTRPEYSFI